MDQPRVGNHNLCIFIACTEVNLFLCINYFLKKDKEFGVFRLRLAYSLIHNESLGTKSDKITWEVSERK